MKAVILDGSREGDDELAVARQALTDELHGLGWQVKPFVLRQFEIGHCLGCFGCWVQTPGECLIDDVARGIAQEVITSQLLVYLTPVSFGGYSSELKKAVDRLICLISPFFELIGGEIHHKKRYDRYPSLVGLGLVENGKGESGEIFARLVGRNALNFHAPAHAAGILQRRQEGEEVRATVLGLLQAVEVVS
jgi:multimeric flavodoxin WrbA